MSAGRLPPAQPSSSWERYHIVRQHCKALPGLSLNISLFPLIVIPPFFCLLVICLLAIKTIGVFYTVIYYLSSPYHLGFNSLHPSLLVKYLIIETSPPLLFYQQQKGHIPAPYLPAISLPIALSYWLGSSTKWRPLNIRALYHNHSGLSIPFNIVPFTNLNNSVFILQLKVSQCQYAFWSTSII